MAFCNSCGTTLGPDAKFCNKCGAAVAGSPGPLAAAASPPSAAPKSGGALKVILIVAAVIVGMGILGIAAVSFVALHVARHSHVTQEGDHVKVETPLGSFSANDPDEAVKELGVDVYPGAEVQKQGTATATFGPVHTVTAIFDTSDPLDKVCDFYKSKFPGAAVRTSDANHCSVTSGGPNSVTIVIDADGGTTKIHIASVTKKSTSSN